MKQVVHDFDKQQPIFQSNINAISPYIRLWEGQCVEGGRMQGEFLGQKGQGMHICPGVLPVLV